jgi:hypothetical protein
MAYQVGGEAPFDTQNGANAMMSNSSFTVAPPGSHPVPPDNNVWSDNVYSGPWGWYAYLYGTCSPLPADPATGKSVPAGACGILDLSSWKSDWQQDTSSVQSTAPATKAP